MRGWIQGPRRQRSTEGGEPCCCSTYRKVLHATYTLVGLFILSSKAFLAKVPMNPSVHHYLVVYLMGFGAIFRPNDLYLVMLKFICTKYITSMTMG